ncbi:mechanosensitive ion channel [bacterium]|nr:mechanosensitive ion channel [bacterium]
MAAIEKASGISPAVQLKLFWSIFLLLLAPLLQWALLLLIRRRAKDTTVVYRSLVVLRYSTAVVLFIALAFIWISGMKYLATYVSIVSAGLVIALQDSVANLAGFIFIVWRRPFKVGDRIEIGGIRGDVIDIRAFQFTLVEVGNWVGADQSTGRIVHVPNSLVLKEPTANYTTGFEYIWDEVPVLVTFESNWRAAKDILSAIAKKHCEHFTPEAERQIRRTSERYLIIAGKLSPIVYTTVRDSGVLLTLRYVTHVRERRGTEQTIWEAILDAFSERSDMDFAYPTTRYYDNRTEGKPGAGAQPE